LLLFHIPKKEGQTRPKTTTRLEEQILSTAIVQKLGTAISRQQRKSFSHRLHPHPVEYLYEHWFHLYQLFLNETRKLAAMSKRVLRADVASFYQNVDQDILLSVIARELNTERTPQEALESMIRRDFPSDHQKGNGLPQGQITSGFWANLYLKQVDEAFEGLDGVEFARYADDMVFAVNPRNISTDSVKQQLLSLLKVLRLETSEDKTFPQSGDEYQEQTKLDQEIDRLAKEIARLRAKLFRLNRDYLRRYSSDRWKFLETYQKLLSTLGICISPNWLGRKIEQEESKMIWFISGSLKFPQYPTSIEEIDRWGDLFRDQNIDWMLQLDAARKRLVGFFSTALGVLADKQKDEYLRELHRRRLRFATNRLCGLGLTPIADQVATEVIGRPWLIEVHWVCPGLSGCGRYDLLLKILRESESAFVRAHALRALAHHASTTT